MIVDLGNRLNVALASQVQELANYRSEFFGRLRQLIGDRSDIRIVGDRFVFQSEVLFSSGSAELEDGGKVQLLQLASTLRDIVPTIPDDIDWVLRIDGHTDVRPIHTDEFPSNWELSTARASAVARLFIDEHGIDPRRVATVGYAEFRPMDADDETANRSRNRRVEIVVLQDGELVASGEGPAPGRELDRLLEELPPIPAEADQSLRPKDLGPPPQDIPNETGK